MSDVLFGVQILHPQTGEVQWTKWLPLEDARRWLTPYYGPCSLARTVREGDDEREITAEEVGDLTPARPWFSGNGTREHPFEVDRGPEGKQFVNGLKHGLGWRIQRG